MRLVEAFKRQKRGWILAEMVALVLVIGYIDYITGYQVRILPFYTVPIFTVAWFCNRNAALAVGVLAGAISLSADWLDGDPDLKGWTRPWEVTRHLATCFVVAAIGTVLRAKTDQAAARIALLEHSQRLEREIVNISEDEQRRIGQDLHDGLCQQLAALSCAASSLHDDLEKSESQRRIVRRRKSFQAFAGRDDSSTRSSPRVDPGPRRAGWPRAGIGIAG